MDYDLRSRCLLLPTHPPQLELLGRDGSPAEIVDVDRSLSADIVSEAAMSAGEQGIGWQREEVRLVPAPKLLELLRRSRKALAAEQPSN